VYIRQRVGSLNGLARQHRCSNVRLSFSYAPAGSQSRTEAVCSDPTLWPGSSLAFECLQRPTVMAQGWTHTTTVWGRHTCWILSLQHRSVDISVRSTKRSCRRVLAPQRRRQATSCAWSPLKHEVNAQTREIKPQNSHSIDFLNFFKSQMRCVFVPQATET